VLPSALLTASASQPAEFSELNLHGLLPCCVRFAPTSRPVNGNTRFRPVCSTVTGRDLHPLDSIKKFHRFIFGSSSSKLFPARWQCRRCQALFEHTPPCTQRRAPFRSSGGFAFSNQGSRRNPLRSGNLGPTHASLRSATAIM